MRNLLIAMLLTILLTGCGGSPAPPLEEPTEPSASPPPEATEPQEGEPTAQPTLSEPVTDAVGYTYHRADGNRYIAEVAGIMPDATALDIPLSGTPEWIAAAPYGRGSVWAVVLTDGTVQMFTVEGGLFEEIAASPGQIEPGQPPMLVVRDGVASLLEAPSDASPLTHPVSYDDDIAYVTDAGGLFLPIAGDDPSASGTVLDVNALPDARLLQDENGRILLLTDPTSDYTHAVLGDGIEARSVTLVEDGEVVQKITVPNGVIEGIAPLWADINGDGTREIIVTVANAQQGARILIYDEQGNQVAQGPAIGQGFRWRHQLAVAPFGPGGTLELVDVLTPHIGGTVEFYNLSFFSIVATQGGYTSHVINTRNLDMALAGDFNGDGTVELALPNQARTALAGVQHNADGAGVVWEVPLDGMVLTNIAAVPNGTLGVGLDTNTLRLWVP